jgi:O-antigen/teichoic acid export membrane protein
MSNAVGTGRRALLINALSNWLGFAAQLAMAFFLSPILVHGLGDRRNGIWSLVESILAYLMLFDLGVAASVVRYVAKFEATRDQESLNRVFNTSLCIFAAAGAAALAIALGLAWLGMGLFHVPDDLLGEARWMLTLLGVNLAAGLPLGVFPSALDGLGRYPVKTLIRTGSLVARSALYVAVLHWGGGLIALAWVITACNLAENAGMAIAAYHYLPGLRFAPRLVDHATFRTIRGYSLDALLAMVAGRVSFQTDAVVIGFFLGPQYITFFGIAAKLVEQAKGSLRAVTTVLTPAVSAWEARGEDDAIRGAFLDGTRWVQWLILPVQAGLLVLGRPFLAVWMGPRYAELCFPTLVILALPLGLAMAQSLCGRVLYGVGRLRWFARAALIEAAANLVLSVLLARPFGIEGVAFGTALPNVVANLAVMGYVCRVLGIGVGTYFRRVFLKPLLLAGGLAAFWLTVVARAEPADWAGLIGTGGVGLVAYLAAAALLELGPAVVWRRLQAALPRPRRKAARELALGLGRPVRPSGDVCEAPKTRETKWPAAIR